MTFKHKIMAKINKKEKSNHKEENKTKKNCQNKY